MWYIVTFILVLVLWIVGCGVFALFRKGHKDGRDLWYDYIMLAPLLIFLKIGQIIQR